MSMICFLPWATVSEPLKFGPFVVEPVTHAIATGGIPPTLLEGVRTVLNGYPSRVDPQHMPLVRQEDHSYVDDLTDDEIAEYFAFRTRLVFGLLSVREFFGHRYCNSDSLHMVVQGFTAELAGGAAIMSRRRDGSATNFVSPGKFRVPKPDHVQVCELPRDIDIALVNALQRDEDLADDAVRLTEAILLFVGANTDSPAVSIHSEHVDTVSAFGRLFNTWKEDPTVEAFLKLLPPPSDPAVKDFGPRLSKELLDEFAGAGKSVRGEWLRDAFRTRHDFGHGRIQMPRYSALWTVREHLLLASYIFPLAVKAVLAGQGLFTLTEEDCQRIDAFDALCTLLPYRDFNEEQGTNPWRETIARFRYHPEIQKLADALLRQLEVDALDPTNS